MPAPKLMSEDIAKRYWCLKEAASLLDVKVKTVYFWIYEFNVSVRKVPGKWMKFTEEDIKDLQRIKFLLKERKFTIAGAKQELKLKGIL